MAACCRYGLAVSSDGSPNSTPPFGHSKIPGRASTSHTNIPRVSVTNTQLKLATGLSRRELGLGICLGLHFFNTYSDCLAAENAVGSFARHMDQLDGYAFSYPRAWIPVRGSGADVFFRDPVNLDENVSVEISSPSSSRFKEVRDLGPPEQAAQKVLKQYLTEFMSTRIGVRRESKIVSSGSRVFEDGKEYYEVQVNVKSYANNRQLAVMPQDRVVQLEWDRRYLSVLGVENNRLYELRLQVPEYVLGKEEGELRKIMDSFRVFKV
ncbi:hypothetical protein KP509_27G030500 [Ceratopteris richardii]|uniref:PsbP C-terminal domain-containing protein n=1 Tax=Ceratopteris richardii TaxID=49495 RepID=A0A8T2RHN6_CERRI|nr:hypothetical protein KP509_27G030500 [Ceratopteris richardii]